MRKLGNLLFLCQNAPFPPHGGQQIRSLNTLKILSQHFNVATISFFRKAIHPDSASVASSLDGLSEFTESALFGIPGESSRIRFLFDHLRSLLSPNSYVWTSYQSDDFLNRVKLTLGKSRPDVVHVDSLDLAYYLQYLPLSRTVVAHHNIESSLLYRRGQNEGGIRGRYLRLQSSRVRTEEAEWTARVRHNWVVSAADGQTLGEISPDARWSVFPNGVDTSFLKPGFPEGGPKFDCVFVGGYTWFPNPDGMRHFAKEILPILRNNRKQISVLWVGRAPEKVVAEFKNLGIQMTGYVDDIRPWVQRARCFIVPIRVGGGTRLKILDAWALGKAVISTTVGCEGLAAVHGKNLLIADGPATFAEKVSSVLDDPELRMSLEKEGRKTAVENYDWSVIQRRVIPVYEEIAGGSKSP